MMKPSSQGMNESASSPLYNRISSVRHLVIVLAFLLIAMHQLVELTWLHDYVPLELFELIYIVIGSVIIWRILTSLRRSISETGTAERSLKKAHMALSKANERLIFLIQVNHRLAQAEDEESLITTMLDLPREVVPAVATSLVRFDQHQQRLPTVYHDSLDPSLLEAWASNLASTETRQACASCAVRSAKTADACSHFLTNQSTLSITKVHCLPLMRGSDEYGILSIYLQDSKYPTPQEQSLLEALALEISLALESQYLRTRELTMLTQIQRARQESNLQNELSRVLTHTVEALEVSGGALFLATSELPAKLQLEAEVGRPLPTDIGLVKGIAEDAWRAEAPLIIRNLEKVEDVQLRSLLAIPIRTGEQALGSLILWSDHPGRFSHRRVQLVATVAGQTALVVANHQLYLQGEYRAALAERARLAREIHDSLAQTIGYLKLRSAQMVNWLQDGDSERTIGGLVEMRQLLNEAYIDTREAIDGLHLAANIGNLQDWLNKMVSEFEEISSISVETTRLPKVDLPLEVQAQFQRIVQEAFNNIRKHAIATRAWLAWQLDDGYLVLTIRDNGRGFDPNDILPIARHGLRIMRERAELIGAELKIASHPGEGTQVIFRLPLPQNSAKEQNGQTNQTASS